MVSDLRLSLCFQLKMLNSLASYLLGYPGSAATAPSSAPEGDAATITAHVPPASLAADVPVDVRLSAVEADDDWLLVDKTGKLPPLVTYTAD